MVRSFVAIHPPADVVHALARAAAELELPERRPTPPDQVHLTLLFLGEVERRDLERTAESVARAAAGVGPFRLRPERLFVLPERGPARLLAAGTDAPPELIELRRRLVGRLAGGRRKVQRFLPHLTLCRFPRPAAVDLAPRALECEPFLVEHVTLMESRLLPAGAQHRGLARAPLGGR